MGSRFIDSEVTTTNAAGWGEGRGRRSIVRSRKAVETGGGGWAENKFYSLATDFQYCSNL